MREAILANLAQISGRETAAPQHNSPNKHWRILAPPNDNGSLRPARSSGGVVRNSRFFVESSQVNVAEKSFS